MKYTQSGYELLKLQSILLEASLLSAASETKEYKESWRKTPVFRQGGRFASKEGGDDTGSQASTSDAKKLDAGHNKVQGTANKIKSALSNFTDAQAKQISSTVASPNVQKAMKAAAEAIDKNISPEAGKAFRQFNGKFTGNFRGTPSVGKAFDKSMEEAKKVIAESAKIGAIGTGIGVALALGGVTGVVGAAMVGVGAGVTALGSKIAGKQGSVWTAIGIESVRPGIKAIFEQKSVPEIAEKFTEGGLSQVTFGAGATLVALGVGTAMLGLAHGKALDSWTQDTINYELERTAGIIKDISGNPEDS